MLKSFMRNNFVSFFPNIFPVHRVRCKSKMENLRKAYVRHMKDEDLMKVTFVYGDFSFPDREFNFLRSKKELLESALKRMKSKVEGAMFSSLQKKKKRKNQASEVESDEIKNFDFYVARDGQKVTGDVSNVEAWRQGSELIINDVTYEIIENAPEVSYLSLPKTIMAGFLVYPKICLEYSKVEDSSFHWYRSITKNEKDEYAQNLVTMDKKGSYFVTVGEGFIYRTTEDDLHHHLKLVCIPRFDDRCGMEEEVISINPITAGPERCPFEKRHEFTKELTKIGCMRCVSYNILADLYADSDTARNELFAHCPPEYLNFEYRKQLYLKEILGYNADLICLQEVDKKVFQNDLVPVLSSVGIDGVYSEKGGTVAEGLTCFFRKSKFKIVYSEAVILSEIIGSDPLFEDIWNKILENDKLKERIQNRTTALQAILLECIDDPNTRILVGNTHLYFHPQSDNIRLIQAAVCVRYLESLKQQLENTDPRYDIAVLLTGDFNSCPEFGVLKFATTGQVPADCIDWQSNSEEAVDGMFIQHGLSLGSACGLPQYTNYTQGFNGCLDYIFYDQKHFSVQDIVPMPTHEDITEYIALPNKVFPSDHIALVCTLKWL